jgi:protein-disulfide isomerase
MTDARKQALGGWSAHRPVGSPPRAALGLTAVCLFALSAAGGCSSKKCEKDGDCSEGSVCLDGKCVSLKGSPGPRATVAPRPGKPDPGSVYRVEVNPKKHPISGADDALVTIVEISDFQCPYCKRGAETVKKVLAKYPKSVRLVFMHNPLRFHKEAFGAAVASQAVFELGGNEAFWKYHDILFANPKRLSSDDLSSYAKRVGVEPEKLAEALKQNKHERTVKRQMALARRLGARGVPAFFINGRPLSGARPLSAFTKLVEEELEKAKELVKKEKVAKADVYSHIMKSAKKKVD